MNWIEVLHVMVSEEKMTDALSHLRSIAEDIASKERIERIEIVKSLIYKTNLLISLHWPSDVRPEKTKVGFALCDQLRKIGMVDHTIWEQTDIIRH